MTGSTFDNPANNRNYQEVNPLIRELVEHIKVIFSSGSELMDEDDQFERKKILNRTNFEKETIKLLIGKLNEIWPEGKTIYQEFEAMNQTLSDLIQNAFDWSELINGPDFSVFIPKMKDKNDNYTLEQISNQLMALPQ
jgi:hypothetical protein